MSWVGRFRSDARLPLFRNAYALFGSSLISSSLGLVYWAIAARVFPPAEVGVSASLISTLIFASGISQLNLQSALYRFVPQAGRRTRVLIGGAYLFVAGMALLVGVAVTLILFWLGAVPTDIAEIGPAELAAFAASVVIWSLFAFQDFVLASLRLSVWVPIENLVFAILKLMLLVGFVWLHPFGIFVSWMLSALIGVIVVSGLIFGVLLRRHWPATRPIHLTIGAVARYAGADYVAGIFMTAGTSLVPVLAFVILGSVASGHFYPVWLITMMLWLAPAAMLSSLLVESSAGHSDFRSDGLRVLKVIGLTVSGPILVLLLAAPLVLLIFGQEYAEVGSAPMRLLALSTIPYAVKSYATYLSRYERRMRRVINIEAGAAIPSLVLAVILAPVLGLVGLALAVLLAQTMIAVVVTATVLRPIIRGWQAARMARPPEGAA